jgi:hypothetical protein
MPQSIFSSILVSLALRSVDCNPIRSPVLTYSVNIIITFFIYYNNFPAIPAVLSLEHISAFISVVFFV